MSQNSTLKPGAHAISIILPNCNTATVLDLIGRYMIEIELITQIFYFLRGLRAQRNRFS